jgi:hypothetical protein
MAGHDRGREPLSPAYTSRSFARERPRLGGSWSCIADPRAALGAPDHRPATFADSTGAAGSTLALRSILPRML